MEQALQSGTTEVSWEEARECGACGSRELRLGGRCGRRRYAICTQCEIERLYDRIAENQLGLVYTSYYPTADPTPAEMERQLTNPTFAVRRRRLEACRGSRAKRILEIGCGDGNFLATLRRAGWDVNGQEVSAATAAIVARRHGIGITAGSLDAVTADRPFPVVAAYHVLEHVYHPATWLRAVRQLLEPKGLLHLQVPNAASLTRRVTGTLWASLRFPQHVYFYEPRTLKALLERFGFTVKTTTTWDPWHGPGTVADTLSNLARRVMRGQQPWSDTFVAREQPLTSPIPPRPGRVNDALRGGLHVAATALSRAEAAVGRGAVVDIIAARD